MAKDECCMDGQIDIFEYLKSLEEKQKSMSTMAGLTGAFHGNRPRRKRYGQDTMFNLIEFQDAYETLKENGKISKPDILEFSVSVCREVYESVYLNALEAVYRYCSNNTTDQKLLKKYSNAYEKEFDRMEKRLTERYSKCS